ncbi:mce related protein [Planctomycetes bacterium Poly30]|uniref:Mce related protein n=1 Tax=Saltatorellus ferox TaxID=2528018 RepID=A0A518EUR0_9BACT|nr:mce related protein [Planctomycetes bacterium Poly30]
MTPRRHILLGLLFLTAIGILSYFTLFKTDFTLFAEQQTLVAYTEDARGLRKGSPVLYAGVRYGKVDSVIPSLERPRSERVRIDITLDEPITLYGDHKVTIESASVLGGVQLGIDPGTKESGVIDADRNLMASAAPDVLASLGELVEENREPLRKTIAGLENVVDTLQGRTGTFGKLLNDEGTANSLTNAIDAITSTFDNLTALSEELRGGQGTIGKLIYDTKLYDDISNFVRGLDDFLAEARALFKDAREGKGILAALVYDEEIPKSFKNTLTSIESATAKIDAGEGTIARLLNDGSIADELQNTLKSFSNQEGTLGKLISSAEIYDNVRDFTADLADASAAIRNQKGTIGELIYDDEIVDELGKAIRVMIGGLEEQREAAPIATFLSTVFLGF